jgi:hypothetical protein
MKNKVTKVIKFDKKDSYGNTSFSIEFENGVRGFYSTKNENQTKFVVGQEAEYELEQKQGAKGPYNKVKVPQTDFKPGGGRPQVEPRIQMISFAAAYAKDIVVAGKVPLSDFAVTFEMIYTEMTNKL